jgi:hypothetical protein
MNTIPPRLVIYAKDVMNITGRQERTARKLLAKIRRQQNKPPGAFVSIDEFCQHTGLKEEKVIHFLK